MKKSAMVAMCAMTVMNAGCADEEGWDELDQTAGAEGDFLADDEGEELGTGKDAFILPVDLCRNVDIRIRNDRPGGRAIKVLRLKMYSEHDNAWHSEDIRNRFVQFGDSVSWPDVDLEKVYSENVSEWKIYYKVQQSNGSFGSTVYRIFDGEPAWVCSDGGGIGLAVE